MADILEFPSRRAQGLTFLERELRKLLAQKGADQALIDFAAGELTTLYEELVGAEQYQLHVALPEGLSGHQRDALYREINEGLGRVQRDNHTLLVGLVARLVLTRLQLFQHQRPDQ